MKKKTEFSKKIFNIVVIFEKDDTAESYQEWRNYELN